MLQTLQRCVLKPKLDQMQVRRLILGIESSCDDSGAAIINEENNEVIVEALEKQKSTQLGGVLPTFAMKSHAVNVPKVVDQVLQDVKIEDIDAIAVTNRPGLNGSLLMGRNYAQYLCYKFQKPMIPIHHMEAHALTPRLTNEVAFPYLVFLISGGHCLLAIAKDIDDFELLGQSTDTAPGEILDKAARRLKLHLLKSELRNVSGGQAIEMMGQTGDPLSIEWPQPMSSRRDCMFSFGGLRTQAERWIRKYEEEEEIQPDQMLKIIPDFCASMEYGLGKFMGKRLQRALEFLQLEDTKINSVVVSGGVASNQRIRSLLQIVCKEYNCNLVVPPVKYCTDNGVMIAWNGVEKWNRQNPKDFVPWQKVFQVEVHPRVPFGQDISAKVAKANIKLPKIKFSG